MIANFLTFWLPGAEADFAGGRHGIEDAGDHLGGASAGHLVCRLGLEELGVRKVFTPGAATTEITGWVAEYSSTLTG